MTQKKMIQKFVQLENKFDTEALNLVRDISREVMNLEEDLQELGTFSSTAISVNALNIEAKKLQGQVATLKTELRQMFAEVWIFLLRSSEDFLENFLQDEKVEEMRFILEHARKEKDFLLTPGEEKILTGHAQFGLQAWGDLYDDIAGSLKVEMSGDKIGLAVAKNYLMSSDRMIRKNAYQGINQAWKEQEISAAAILNSLNGWRLENYKTRSHKRPMHFLDKACHFSKIDRSTLTALIDTTYRHRSIGQRALKLMAKELGLKQLAPWDLMASYPASKKEIFYSFPEGINLIFEAFKTFSQEMADFVLMMVNNKWIDASPSENRSQGAYCTKFLKKREPRVFMTYDGTISSIITLAHELGHAYHSWVMRDLKAKEMLYPMTLAETASIFAETLVKDYLFSIAQNKEEKKKILWQELESAGAYIINIPSRYELEKRIVEERSIRSLQAEDFKALTRTSWQYWYEDTLSEYDEMFWASKLHFSIPELPFYNYPYLFGQLFSLGIYAKKEEYGEKFAEIYKDILRDTGRMSAEHLIKKYFSEDISNGEFWEQSLKIIEKSVNKFEELS